MATTLPRIQAYVAEDLHEKFVRWRRKKGLEGDSKALSRLLTEFFAKPEAPIAAGRSFAIESLPGIEAKITEIVEDQLGDLQALISSTVDCALREVASKLPSVDQVQSRIDEVVEQGRTWIDQLGERLHDRIHRLEQNQAEIVRKRQEPDRDLEALVGSKIDGIKLSLPSSDELPGELPGELLHNSLGQPLDKEDTASKESDNLPSELLSEFPATRLSLTGAQLAKRLDINRSTLPRNRDKPDFASWSQARDPEAIAWEYDAKEKVYRSKKAETERTGTSKLKSLAILHKGGS